MDNAEVIFKPASDIARSVFFVNNSKITASIYMVNNSNLRIENLTLFNLSNDLNSDDTKNQINVINSTFHIGTSKVFINEITFENAILSFHVGQIGGGDLKIGGGLFIARGNDAFVKGHVKELGVYLNRSYMKNLKEIEEEDYVLAYNLFNGFSGFDETIFNNDTKIKITKALTKSEKAMLKAKGEANDTTIFVEVKKEFCVELADNGVVTIKKAETRTEEEEEEVKEEEEEEVKEEEDKKAEARLKAEAVAKNQSKSNKLVDKKLTLQKALNDSIIQIFSVVSNRMDMSSLSKVFNTSKNSEFSIIPDSKVLVASSKNDFYGIFVQKENQMNFWIEALYNRSKLNVEKGYESTLKGTTFGFEQIIENNLKLGFGYAYSKMNHKAESKNTSRNLNGDLNTVFVYGACDFKDFYTNSIILYGFNKFAENNFVKNDYKLVKAKFNDNSFAMQAIIGKDFSLFDFAKISPEFGLRYYNIIQDSYKDSDSNKISKIKFDNLVSSLGIKLEKIEKINKKMKFGLVFKVAGTYDLLKDKENYIINLASDSLNQYVVKTKDIYENNRFALETKLNAIFEFNDSFEINLGYKNTLRKKFVSNTGTINFKFMF